MKELRMQKIKTKKILYKEALIPERGQKQLIEIWLANIETQANRKKLKNEFRAITSPTVHLKVGTSGVLHLAYAQCTAAKALTIHGRSIDSGGVQLSDQESQVMLYNETTTKS